jgi:hypothetical protein
MTEFYENLRQKYSPHLTPLQSAMRCHVIESRFFDQFPEFCPPIVPVQIEFTEELQNRLVEYLYAQGYRREEC